MTNLSFPLGKSLIINWGASLMWSAFRQARRLAQEGFTHDEIKEILQRAAELQSQAERKAHDERIQREALKAGAKAAGIREDFLEQAIEEFKAKRQTKRKIKGWGLGKIALAFMIGLFALPIALFTLGVIWFSLSVTLTVLLAVGLALAAAGFALLLTMPFVGVGMIAGLLAALNRFAKRLSNPHTWRRSKDDDED